MAENLPQNPTDALALIEARAPRWIDKAGQIGLSEQLAQEVSDLAAQARARRVEAGQARARAKSATRAWKDAIAESKKRTRAAIAAIKAHAAATDAPNVYSLARLSSRARAGEAPPPRRTTHLGFHVRPRGDVELSWQGQGSGAPQGVYYIVQRSLDGGRTWSVLGTTTSKCFVDEALPVGQAETFYTVIARHGEHEVWGSVLPVRLGTKEATGDAAADDRAA